MDCPSMLLDEAAPIVNIQVSVIRKYTNLIYHDKSQENIYSSD